MGRWESQLERGHSFRRETLRNFDIDNNVSVVYFYSSEIGICDILQGSDANISYSNELRIGNIHLQGRDANMSYSTELGIFTILQGRDANIFYSSELGICTIQGRDANISYSSEFSSINILPGRDVNIS